MTNQVSNVTQSEKKLFVWTDVHGPTWIAIAETEEEAREVINKTLSPLSENALGPHLLPLNKSFAVVCDHCQGCVYHNEGDYYKKQMTEDTPEQLDNVVEMGTTGPVENRGRIKNIRKMIAEFEVEAAPDMKAGK